MQVYGGLDMKIRTDFVTNSSSSSFSIEIAIIDKTGEKYSLSAIPYEWDENVYFSGELKDIMTRYAYKKLENLEKKYDLIEVDKAGRSERIESIKVGDIVQLVKVQTDNKYIGGYYAEGLNCYIDVRNTDGSLGILPIQLTWILRNYIDYDDVEIVATIADVQPLSQRSETEKALVSIHIETKVCREESSIIRFSDIADLCKFLTASINYEKPYDEYDEYDEDEYDEDDIELSAEEKIEEEKRLYTDQVIRKVKTIDNISKIIVRNRYGAFGESTSLIADHDERLCELAKKVNDASGAVREAAKAEMLEYIHTSNGRRGDGMPIGNGFDDFRYIWSDDDGELEKLVKRLCSTYAPTGEEGDECYEINMKTGEYVKYAELRLE